MQNYPPEEIRADFLCKIHLKGYKYHFLHYDISIIVLTKHDLGVKISII